MLRRVMQLGWLLVVSAAVLPAVVAAELLAAFYELITPVPPATIPDALRVKLGSALFADPKLSGTGTRSCASCHDLRINGMSPEQRDRAPDGRLLEALPHIA